MFKIRFAINLALPALLLLHACSFEVPWENNFPPDAPVLISPADDQEGLPAQPLLQWEASTDPNGQQVGYDVYFGSDSTDMQLMRYHRMDTTYKVKEVLEGETTYYWQVVSLDEYGDKSKSRLNSFVTGPLFHGRISLTGQSDIDDLAGKGYLYVEELFISENYSNPVQDLSLLSTIQQVGSLKILNLTQLESLQGLDNIKTIDFVMLIRSCRKLKDLQGLNGLEKANWVDIEWNYNMQTMEGLESLVHINEELQIEDNNALLSLDGLNSLAFLGKSLKVTDNINLEDFCALKGLMMNFEKQYFGCRIQGNKQNPTYVEIQDECN